MEQTQKKTPRLIPNVRIGQAGALDVAALRAFAQSDPKAFARRADELIENGELSLEKVTDIRSLFFALADVQVPTQMQIMDGYVREIMASAFPVLVGGMVVNGFNAAYDAVAKIGQDLVTEIADNHRVTSLAAIHAMDTNVPLVKESDPFPEISAEAERAEIRSKRNGRKLTISAEAIEENNTPDIVNRVNALAEIAADWTEEQTLDRICDRYGSATSPAEPYVYHPNGVGTQLFNATANLPGARAPSGTRKTNNQLNDETDLDAVRTVLAAMKNNRGKRIFVPMSRCILLVPDALAGTALKILNSELVPGVENEIANWGPRGAYRPTLLSSPKLDDISTSAWYLGDFKRQFTRKWKLRMEYVTLAGDAQAFLNSRVAFQARIAWDMEVGAVDYVYVVQSLAGTTAP